MKSVKLYKDADYNYEYPFPTQVKTITNGRFTMENDIIEDIKYKIGSRTIQVEVPYTYSNDNATYKCDLRS